MAHQRGIPPADSCIIARRVGRSNGLRNTVFSAFRKT